MVAGRKEDGVYTRDEVTANIPVGIFIERYEVVDPRVQEVLYEFPTLCLMLGEATVVETLPSDEFGQVSLLTKGSGMFGLKDKTDALRWSGILNHVVGNASHVYTLARILKELTVEEQQRFAEFGFDPKTFAEIDPDLLRDFVFLSHCGRRSADERRKYHLDDNAHQHIHSGKATVSYLQSQKTHRYFMKLARVENDVVKRAEPYNDGYIFPSIIDNILTYADWTFDQRPTSLQTRFILLSARRREAPEVLAKLEQCAKSFERAITEIVGPKVWDQMVEESYPWEKAIREAYCEPSGLKVEEVFPLSFR